MAPRETCNYVVGRCAELQVRRQVYTLGSSNLLLEFTGANRCQEPVTITFGSAREVESSRTVGKRTYPEETRLGPNETNPAHQEWELDGSLVGQILHEVGPHIRLRRHYTRLEYRIEVAVTELQRGRSNRETIQLLIKDVSEKQAKKLISGK